MDRSAAHFDEDLELDELVPGTQVNRYVVERLIGRGAMGTVYAAHDPDLDRKVALKLLRADSLSASARGRVRERLLREAKAMARLSHPDVITVHDVGAFGERLFVAMEYIDGGTLRHWRAARHRSFDDILEVYERAGSGLAAAHEAGLVHRDFKPDNVLVDRDGRVRVTDFGLARSLDRPADSAVPAVSAEGSSIAPSVAMTLTRSGTVLGTPAYMAPEQLRGEPADPRSDVFSFCVALYEALYGERPFSGRNVRELQAAIERRALRASPITTRVPRWVHAVLQRGLHASPGERFDSMRGLLEALRAAHERSRQRWRRAVVGTVVAAGLAAALGLYARRAPTAALSAPAFEAPTRAVATNEATDRSREEKEATDRATEKPLPVATTLRAADMQTVDAPTVVPPRQAHRNLPTASPARVARAASSSSAGEAGVAVPASSAPRVGHNGALILE